MVSLVISQWHQRVCSVPSKGKFIISKFDSASSGNARIVNNLRTSFLFLLMFYNFEDVFTSFQVVIGFLLSSLSEKFSDEMNQVNELKKEKQLHFKTLQEAIVAMIYNFLCIWNFHCLLIRNFYSRFALFSVIILLRSLQLFHEAYVFKPYL